MSLEGRIEGVLFDFNQNRRNYNKLAYQYNEWYYKNENVLLENACDCGIISTTLRAAQGVIDHIENSILPLIENGMKDVQEKIREPYLESFRGENLALSFMLDTVETQIKRDVFFENVMDSADVVVELSEKEE